MCVGGEPHSSYVKPAGDEELLHASLLRALARCRILSMALLRALVLCPRRRWVWCAAALWAALLLCLASCSVPDRQTASAGQLILATTTSVQDCGLLDELVPLFMARSGLTVQVVAVGSGAALAMGSRGDADVLLVHSPEEELALLREGHVVERLPVMHNAFLLVGPPDDPARVSGAQSAAAALARIAQAQVPFFSRGDGSGTYRLELALWRQAGIAPGGPWYQATGQGMGATLRIASERGGYTISDRATFIALRKGLALSALFEDPADEMLINRYSVLTVNPQRHPKANAQGARLFAQFLTSPEVQSLIAQYGRDRFGEALFFPDALRPSPGGVALPPTAQESVLAIALRTLEVSGLATLASVLIGVPLGTLLALSRFRGRGLVLALVNTGMGLPPVVVGLVVALALWRTGPLGSLGLMYTRAAMVLAQVIIAVPIVAGLTASGLQQLGPELRLQLEGLGLERAAVVVLMWWQARLALLAAAIAGFGGAISEVGASMMVGGNIAGQTRVLTTATVLEVSRGNFAGALWLGAVLLGLSFAITVGATYLQQRSAAR
jgi:tungstate transport system substrate-binding protein